jgi:hypothetical protein
VGALSLNFVSAGLGARVLDDPDSDPFKPQCLFTTGSQPSTLAFRPQDAHVLIQPPASNLCGLFAFVHATRGFLGTPFGQNLPKHVNLRALAAKSLQTGSIEGFLALTAEPTCQKVTVTPFQKIAAISLCTTCIQSSMAMCVVKTCICFSSSEVWVHSHGQACRSTAQGPHCVFASAAGQGLRPRG